MNYSDDAMSAELEAENREIQRIKDCIKQNLYGSPFTVLDIAEVLQTDRLYSFADIVCCALLDMVDDEEITQTSEGTAERIFPTYNLL